MDKAITRAFIAKAKTYAKRHGRSMQSLSKTLFNGNPYAFERLDAALKKGSGGPGHVAVIEAARLLAELEASEEEERVLA